MTFRSGSYLIFLMAIVLFGSGCRSTSNVARLNYPQTQPADRSALFEEVSDRVGIQFRHVNAEGARPLFGDSVGGGCAFLDVDGDGYQDILLLSCGHFGKILTSDAPNLKLYRNRGDGVFEDVTAGSGLDKPLGCAQGIAIGDYDNDGRPDIFIAGYGACWLFHNESTRQHIQFRDVTRSAGLTDTDKGIRWATGAVWGDYDNDGKLDLYLIHYCLWSPEQDKVCARADGTPGYCSPAAYEPDSGRLFHNDGNGHFHDVTAASGLGRLRGRGLAAAWIDYDADGFEDLVIANDLNPNQLLHNNGNGTFTEVGSAAGVALGMNGQSISGMGIALGDYDHSGRESLFITSLNNQVFSLYHNEGAGLFAYATDRAGLLQATQPHSGWGITFVDFDRDGLVDVVSGNGNVHPLVSADLGAAYAEPKGVYRNLGGGRFVDVSPESGATTPRATRGLVSGDFDNDGRMDILCINRNDRAELFHNISRDHNHWIRIQVVGTRSNRDGAGAKVWVTSNGVRQYAECRLGSSYASSPDKRLFFGLGLAGRVDALSIRWPSGQHDDYKGIDADQTLTATEGRGADGERGAHYAGLR